MLVINNQYPLEPLAGDVNHPGLETEYVQHREDRSVFSFITFDKSDNNRIRLYSEYDENDNVVFDYFVGSSGTEHYNYYDETGRTKIICNNSLTTVREYDRFNNIIESFEIWK